jgi:hypothetical protein
MRLTSLLVIAAASCAPDHDHGTVADACGDGGAYERIEVTDEACRAFTEAESRGQVVVDATKAPSWTNPLTKVVVAPPPRFAWAKGTLAHRKTLGQWLIGEAWAHGDTTGDAFVLTFRDRAGKELHRVLTTNVEYTPAAANWDKIRAGGTFVVTLTGVRFTRNVIATGTRATSADPLTITVE